VVPRPERGSGGSGTGLTAISFANRNEKSHLPYGEGTLRAEPLAEALAGFDRDATVIGESPDEESNRTIHRILVGGRRPQRVR
jgi:endonuclease IV